MHPRLRPFRRWEFLLFRSAAGPLVHGRMPNASSWVRAHRVPLQPPDLLLCAGGEILNPAHNRLMNKNKTDKFNIAARAWLQKRKLLQTPAAGVVLCWVGCSAQLFRPLTATPTRPSLPPSGFERGYISGLRHVHDQQRGRHHLHLQEEVRSRNQGRMLYQLLAYHCFPVMSRMAKNSSVL